MQSVHKEWNIRDHLLSAVRSVFGLCVLNMTRRYMYVKTGDRRTALVEAEKRKTTQQGA